MSIEFPSHPELAKEVAAYLEANGMATTTFGVRALGDPALIDTLRRGRELRRRTIERIRMYMLTGRGHAADAESGTA